jgi:hypothetical protein
VSDEAAKIARTKFFMGILPLTVDAVGEHDCDGELA